MIEAIQSNWVAIAVALLTVSEVLDRLWLTGGLKKREWIIDLSRKDCGQSFYGNI